MTKILDFIKPGVVTGNNVQKIFDFAKKNNFALPAINCIGIDSINAALEAAANMQSPIILQFSKKGSSFMAGYGLNSDKNDHNTAVLGAISGSLHVHHISKHYGIPVILHTDHCTKKNLPWINALLDLGTKHFYETGSPLFSSHMIDLSEESLKENIEISSKYLSRMHKLNMTLEIELGCTGGEEDGIDHYHLDHSLLYTTPEDITYAYEKLHIISPQFIIAASFGNVHGVYKPGNIRLDPKILQKSQKCVSNKFGLPDNFLNLVFHGGSGSTEEEIKEAISYGVVKMNIDTDIQWATWEGILKYYQHNKNFLQTQLGNPYGSDQPNKKFYDPRIWIRAGQKSMVKYLEKTFCTLNAVNIL
ncbi:class II fructose-bisphosphate aldolase [Blochmannia endosymbiont of Camponotus sp.]|uniref:class II fructose-bisphosphate aldolase n=1 Tax=Blochmannia endosymbiont of Camponotus sp. TaxID=700220 RepID=UPI0020244D4D|nr:class II fructose-bisphosphate aldolase [Blochmannia endosymbiont of Camponotus sp.]URJ25645.1 class II fructose-bisphosphate aldolase [Blochmannia endosymbiont of Camponotus sp.]